MVTTSPKKVIEVRNGFLYDGEMAAMVFSEEPDLIFSLNKTYKKLVYIDPSSKIITKDIVLPDFEPLDCKYSMTDKKLYLVSGYSNKITIWDKVSETFQQYPFTESEKGRKITIDPIIEGSTCLMNQEFRLFIWIILLFLAIKLFRM